MKIEKVPNQKSTYLNQTKDLNGQSYIRVGSDYALNAIMRMNKCGIAIYFYLLAQTPHTYDTIIRNTKRGPAPFVIYPSSIANRLSIDIKTAENGINELIEFGYLIPTRIKDVYQFNDYTQEDLLMTPKEYEEMITLEEAMQMNQGMRKNKLEQIAEERAEKKNIEKLKEKYPMYDWENEEEYLERISKKS